MKKNVNLLFFVLLFIGLVSLNSCKKDKLPSMSCKIGTDSWTSLFRYSAFGSIDVDGSAGGFLITGTDKASESEGKYISILIRGNELKSYSLETAIVAGKFECAAVYFPAGLNVGDKYVGNTGTVTITELDTKEKKISGSFSFTLKKTLLDTESISITEGVFENLSYSEPGALGLTLFSALVK